MQATSVACRVQPCLRQQAPLQCAYTICLLQRQAGSSQSRQQRRQHRCTAAAQISAGSDILPTEEASIVLDQQETARESAVALLQLLRSAALLAAVGCEIGSLLQHNRFAAAERETAGHAAAAQEQAARQAAQQAGQRRGRQDAVQVMEAPMSSTLLLQHHGMGGYALEHGGVWGVLLALLCTTLLGWLQKPRGELAHLSSPVEASSTAALHLAVSRQAAALSDARAQLTKLQLRVRTGLRDLRTSLRQAQRQDEQQADTLTALASGAEQQQAQLQDFQVLLEAMQVVSSKQFALLVRALPLVTPQLVAEGPPQPLDQGRPPAADLPAQSQTRPNDQQHQQQPEDERQRTQQQAATAAVLAGRQQGGNGSVAAAVGQTPMGSGGAGSSALPPHSAFHDVPAQVRPDAAPASHGV